MRLPLALFLAAGLVAGRAGDHPHPKPNILVILADDLGYGDVSCFNPAAGLIQTPSLDRLASQGMLFTDAHSGSSVCTPTRYGLLTGRYAWRTRLQSGVLGGFSPPLIAPARLTLPALLKQNGYSTACIGKWHLGMTWPRTNAGSFTDDIQGGRKKVNEMHAVDWSAPIMNGPITLGFDHFFGISASLDMPPFVFIRGDRVTEKPTVEKQFVRLGPAAASFEARDVLPSLIQETLARIRTLEPEARRGRPFFIYLALTSPHTPVTPAQGWRGKSGLGDYADFVMQTDEAVGRVVSALDQSGLGSNTLVIATSDNGFSPAGDPVSRLRNQGHRPSAQYRGYKADIWEGGHRVPFIVRWPREVPPGSRSSQVVCLTDLMATFADLLSVKLPDHAAEDSYSFLPALLGRPAARRSIVHHSINGSFAIRDDNWKLALCPGSGGWSEPKPGSATEKDLPRVQLYDLAADPSESKNASDTNPEIVTRLEGLLDRLISDGRSSPGPPARNDAPVKRPPASP